MDMNKIGQFLLNILFIILHLAALWFIEALCFAKLLTLSKGEDWFLWHDVLILGFTVLILAVHYLILLAGRRRGIIQHVSVAVLTVFEVFLTAAVIFLFAGGLIHMTFVESLFYVAIQMAILAPRFFCFRFI